MAYKELHNVVFCGNKDCRKVYRFDNSDGSDGIRSGDILYSFQDAAEFEARVAEKLAKPRKELRPKGCSWYETTEGGHLVRKNACPPHRDIDNCPGVAACSLYLARLAAEAEMEA